MKKNAVVKYGVYIRKRPVSLIILFLSGLIAYQAFMSFQRGSNAQMVYRLVNIAFFAASIVLFIFKWYAFVFLNICALLFLVVVSAFLMVVRIDPLMGLTQVTAISLFIGLLLREWHRIWLFESK